MPRSIAIFAFGLSLLAGAAFWPMYLSKSWSAVDRYTHAHAALGTLWMLILILQPVLILLGYRPAHRIVGRTSLLVAVGFVLSGLLLTHYRLSRMTDAVFARDGIYIYLPLAVAVLFAAACVLGFLWRKSAPVHGRFMVSTALLLIDPVLARIMFFYLPPMPSDHFYQGITFTLIMAAMVYLLSSLPPQALGRPWFRSYCIGTATVFLLFFAVPYTAPWLAFVNWFRVLQLT